MGKTPNYSPSGMCPMEAMKHGTVVECERPQLLRDLAAALEAVREVKDFNDGHTFAYKQWAEKHSATIALAKKEKA